MDEQHNKLMAYVLDNPELAAVELRELRYQRYPWMFVCFLAGLLVGLWFG